MRNRILLFGKDSAKAILGGTISVNDLREKEWKEFKLLESERIALQNFDRWRLDELNSQTSEDAFHQRYQQLQVMANMTDYREFLKAKYFRED